MLHFNKEFNIEKKNHLINVFPNINYQLLFRLKNMILLILLKRYRNI